MQRALCDFYKRKNPSKLSKSTISILIQYWWDYGLGPLNRKLQLKYGDVLRLKDPLDGWPEGSFTVTVIPDKSVRLESYQNHLIVTAIERQNQSEHFNGPGGKPLKRVTWKQKQKRVSRHQKKPPINPPNLAKRMSQPPPPGVNREVYRPPGTSGPSFRTDKGIQSYRPQSRRKKSGGKKRRPSRKRSKPHGHIKPDKSHHRRTPPPPPPQHDILQNPFTAPSHGKQEKGKGPTRPLFY